MLPLAHAGHYLWVLYLPPVLIVLASIVRTTLAERRERDKPTRSPSNRWKTR